LMALGGFGIKSREEVALALKELGVSLNSASDNEVDKKKKTRAKSTDAEDID
jgi:hypothetical protein